MPHPAPQSVLLSEVTRSGEVESTHHGAVVVVDSSGARLLELGDAATPVWTRSVVKPFQAVASLERGLVDSAGLEDSELAVVSASHDGTELHVETVRGLLEKLRFTEADLLCGPHAPFDKRASIAVARSGGKPQRIHNNCSGKHSAMLWLARELGVDPADYLDPDSASQRQIKSVLGDFVGLDPATIPVGLDGCGAPTFRLPLEALARGFARLMNPVGLSDVRAAACTRLRSAIAAAPVLYEGEGGICTALARSWPGQIVGKNGAEGVYAIGVLRPDGSAVGAAVAVHDGAPRGYHPVIAELAMRLTGTESVPEPLRSFVRVPVWNTQKIQVGEVRSAIEWPDL